MQNDRPVAQKFAMIGFVAWCVWLAIELGLVLTHLPGRTASLNLWVATLGGIPTVAGGCVLTWFLAKQPNAGLSVVFVILCAFLLCRFCVSEIVLGMSPQFGGYTLSQSVSAWLSRHTVSLERFLLWFPRMVLLGISLFFYPIYCLTYDRTAARSE